MVPRVVSLQVLIPSFPSILFLALLYHQIIFQIGSFLGKITQHNIKTYFVAVHGKGDGFIFIQTNELLRDIWELMGIKIQGYYYTILHSLCASEINTMSRFI